MAVERSAVAAQLAEVEEAVNAAQQVAARDVIVEIEGVEETVLVATSLTHHLDAPVVPKAQGQARKMLGSSTEWVVRASLGGWDHCLECVHWKTNVRPAIGTKRQPLLDG